MKKNVCAWSPAILEYWKEAGKQRLRISYWQTDPSSGKRDRFRPTFGLNRQRLISSGLQEQTAKILVDKINKVLPLGYPFLVDLDGLPVKKDGAGADRLARFKNGVGESADLSMVPVLEALELARKIKCNTDRKETVKTYNSTVGQLKRFITSSGLESMAIGEFSRQLAIAYLDAAEERGIGNNTYNNIIRNCRAVFSCLMEREYLLVNPFQKIKGKRKVSKMRTRFCPEDRSLVAQYIRENHPWFYIGVLLQYFCLIRPIEICRLQFKHFDLANGVIRMPCEITKSWKEGFPTIPASILHYFNSGPFLECPGSWHLFSNNLKPGVPLSAPSIRRKTMTAFHKDILDKLDGQGKLRDRTGLSWYSWSDTGIDDRRREGFNIFDLKELKRHESVTTTEMYLHHDKINKAVLRVPNVLEKTDRGQ